MILRNAISSVSRPPIIGVTLVIVVIALVVNLTFYAIQRYLEVTWGVTLQEGQM